jgi:hypothetical protein
MADKKLMGPAGEFETIAWQFIWQHKKILFALIAFPLFLQMGLAYFFKDLAPGVGYIGSWLSIKEQFSSFQINGVFELLTVFWVIGWLRYFLNNEIPSLGTYFKWDKSHFLYLAYVSIVLCMEGAIHNDFIMYFLAGMASIYGVFLSLLTLLGFLIYLLLLPFRLWVPTIAAGKPVSLKIWKQVKPFYWSYFGSLFFMAIRMGFIGLAMLLFVWGFDFLLRLNNMSVNLYVYYFLALFLTYLGSIGIVSVSGVYYREFLKGKK